MLKYKQIWHRIKPTRWLIKFDLTDFIDQLWKKGRKWGKMKKIKYQKIGM